MTLELTVFMLISCLMRSCCDLVILNAVMSTYAHHCLNVRNVINWKSNFKENIIKNTLIGERMTKEVVWYLLGIESYSSAFH